MPDNNWTPPKGDTPVEDKWTPPKGDTPVEDKSDGKSKLKSYEGDTKPKKDSMTSSMTEELFGKVSTRNVAESTAGPKISRREELSQQVQEAPKRKEAKEQKIKETKQTALKNSVKQSLKNNNTSYVEGDLSWKNAESKIQEGVDSDKLALSFDKLNNPYYVKSLNGFEALWEGIKQSFEKEKQGYEFVGADIENKIKLADKAIEENTIPESVITGSVAKASEFVGGSAEQLALGFGAGIGGASAGGAVAGPVGAFVGGVTASFLALSPSAYTGAVHGEAIKRYSQSINEIKASGREVTQEDKIDAMNKAVSQGQIAGGVEVLKTAALSFIPAGKGASGKGFVNLLKQDIKHTGYDVLKFGGLSVGGSLATDISAKEKGYNVSLSEMITNGIEKGGEGATTAAAFGVAHGLLNVSKYTRAGALEYLSTIERPKLVSYSMAQEANGLIPKGATEKMIGELDSFKQAQDKVPSFIPDENKASFSGNIRRKMNLEEQKRMADPSFHSKIDEEIANIDKRIKEMTLSADPTKLEVDDVTGATGEPVPQTESHIQSGINDLNKEETVIHKGEEWTVKKDNGDGTVVVARQNEAGVESEITLNKSELEKPAESEVKPTEDKDVEHKVGDTVTVTSADGTILGENAKVTAVSDDGKFVQTELGNAYLPKEQIQKQPELEKPAYTQTEEGKTENLKAQDLGFDNVTHAINSVNKELGTDYKTIQEIPESDLKKVSETKTKPTEEEIKLHQEAEAQDRVDALNKTKQDYDTSRSREGVGVTAPEVPKDVLSEPISSFEFAKDATPEESAKFDEFRKSRYKSPEEFKSEYEREHRREIGETREEYLRRKSCE